MRARNPEESLVHRVARWMLRTLLAESAGSVRGDHLALCPLAVAVCFTMFLSSHGVTAAEPTDQPSQSEFVLALDADYFARLASEPSSIAELLHEDFQYLTHYQTELSKSRLLEYLRQSPKLVERFQLGVRYVLVQGGQALVWGTVRTQGQSGEFESVTSRYWHVWERQESGWVLRRRQADLLDRETH
jgi:hypothetical protein